MSGPAETCKAILSYLPGIALGLMWLIDDHQRITAVKSTIVHCLPRIFCLVLGRGGIGVRLPQKGKNLTLYFTLNIYLPDGVTTLRTKP